MTYEQEQGKRQEKRDSLFLSATVRIGESEPFVTRVRNLSAGGMMIDAAEELANGTVLSAEIRGIGKIAGRIAWSSPGRAGVAFDKDVDPRLARAGSGTKSVMPEYLKTYGPAWRSGLTVR
jgi:hypothetical protein